MGKDPPRREGWLQTPGPPFLGSPTEGPPGASRRGPLEPSKTQLEPCYPTSFTLCHLPLSSFLPLEVMSVLQGQGLDGQGTQWRQWGIPPPGSPNCFLHCQHSTFTSRSRSQDWASHMQDSLQGPRPRAHRWSAPRMCTPGHWGWKPAALARGYKPRSLPQATGGHSTLRNKRCPLAGRSAESSLPPSGYHVSEHLGVEACPFTVRGQGSSGPSPTPLSTVSLTHRGDLITLCTTQTEVAPHLSLGVMDVLALTPSPSLRASICLLLLSNFVTMLYLIRK